MDLTTSLVAAGLKALNTTLSSGAKRLGEGIGKPAAEAVLDGISAHSPAAAKLLKRKKTLGDSDVLTAALLVLGPVESSPRLAGIIRDWLAALIDAKVIDSEFELRRVGSEYPPHPRIFADRVGDRATIVNAAHAGGDIATLLFLAGQPLAGKTALVRYLVHHPEPQRFADGIHYVDLKGLRTDKPADPGAIATRLLVQVGLMPSLIPVEPERAIEWWRRLIRGRSLCVIFDHVMSAEEVEPLLPIAAASMAVVVADTKIAELLGARAILHKLSGFGVPAAREFFDMALKPGWLDDEQALEQVVNACRGIPGVLRVVAGILVGEPGTTMSDIALRLTDGSVGVEELHAAGGGTMRVYDELYARLSPKAKRAYRTLGLLPNHGAFGLEWLRTASGLGYSTIRACEELKARFLIDVAPSGPDLWTNTVIRMHARQLLQEAGEYPTATQQAAHVAFREWHATTLQHADEALSRNSPLRLTSVSLKAANPFASSRAALSWVEEHQSRLVAFMYEAFMEREYLLVIRLAEAMQTYLVNRRPVEVFCEVYRLAVSAAQELKDPRYEARMRCLLSRALRESQKLNEAQEQVDEATKLVNDLPDAESDEERIRDEKLKASVKEFVGLVTLDRGRPDEAYNEFEQARRVHEAIGNDRGYVLTSQMMGRARTRSGKSDEPVQILRAALQRVSKLDDRLHGRLLLDLAQAQLDVGDGVGAAASATSAMPFLEDQLMSRDMDTAKALRAQGRLLSSN